MKGRVNRQRQDVSEQSDNDVRQRGAGDEPDGRADGRERYDLRQVDREYLAPGGAKRLEGRDHVSTLVEMAYDRIGDADAADQQGGEAHQRQKLGEARDVAFELGRGVAAAANLPARFRQCGAGFAGQPGDSRIG